MNRKVYQLFFVVGGIVGSIFLLIDYRLAIGIFGGMLTSFVSQLLLTWEVTDMLKTGKGNGVKFGMFAILRLALQMSACLLYFVFPIKGIIFAVLFGLVLFRLCIQIEPVLSRRSS